MPAAMECHEVRKHLLDLQRDRVDPDLRREIGAHLESCEGCSRASEAERVLSELLERRLPQHPAPAALKRRLAVLAPTAPASRAPAAPRARFRWSRAAAPALAAALALTAGVLVVERATTRSGAELSSLTAEAVNDHLRVLNASHPFDIASGANHQVKPWFEGKLDFAPNVPLPVVQDLRLLGGAVGYYFDRKAAVVMYALRRHAVTMLVFRADELPWPERDAKPLGGVQAIRRSSRGFHVVMWRTGGLCYALVSDVDPRELDAVAAKFAAAT